ncbi:MAG: precorrin-2 C(20)-methyltransferase [Chloroflexi bacterium]|nr:precorrin-2 C(20)-methyltransferase [Chloroflexota bacterium]MDA1219404.1 precorrin-2 C(20)-methyltransferase [Chloroflexota bacterium]
MTNQPTSSSNGRLYGVGVGPGDPELLTLKAKRILQQVPIVCVPQAETSRESYALNIVREFLDLEKQEILRIPFPTDDEEAAGDVWRKAAETLAVRLYAGQDVAFITEGDPMLYSTFSYVLESIRANHSEIPVEIVPGVSSVMAAAASAVAPLVTHGQRLAILPAVYGIDDLRQAIASYDTIVLMKVNRTLLDALVNLEKLGLAGKAIYVRRASTAREQVVRDLQQLSEENLDYFSLLIIRK